MQIEIPDLIRYATWGGVLATAEANRRHYRMTTVWLPHLAANTLALLLPDAQRLLDRVLAKRPDRRRGPVLARLAADTCAALVRDNRAYVAYVLPLAAGYILSHPRFTIYKGPAAELKLAGFGLDALPHAATAFALTALVGDALRTAAARSAGAERAILAAAQGREPAVTALVLAAATLVWELGEHRIHRHELALKGSAEAIDMQWSPEDTLYDCLANTLGWAAATLWRRRRSRRPGPPASQRPMDYAPSAGRSAVSPQL